MKFISPLTYRRLLTHVASVRHLRKIKFFPRPTAVTVVTYYKETTNQQSDYTGTAYTLSWYSPRLTTTPLAHSQHLSPVIANTDEDEEEGEIEVDPQPSLAIGCRALINQVAIR